MSVDPDLTRLFAAAAEPADDGFSAAVTARVAAAERAGKMRARLDAAGLALGLAAAVLALGPSVGQLLNVGVGLTADALAPVWGPLAVTDAALARAGWPLTTLQLLVLAGSAALGGLTLRRHLAR